MERDSVLKLSITVKLIKSENDEELRIAALSFPDPQSTKLSTDICYLYQEVLIGPQLSILHRMTSKECAVEIQAIRS